MKKKIIIPAVIVPVLCVVIPVLLGEKILSFRDVALFFGGAGDPGTRAILSIRIPRILLAIVAGASLSVSGTVFQAILRNPLADPFVVGISGGAAFGTAWAVVFNLSSGWLVILSLGGAMMAVGIVYALSFKKEMGEATVILSGIALSFIFSSGVMILFSIAASDKVHRTVMWLMGDLSMGRYSILPHAGLLCLILILILWSMHRRLDVISFGEGFSRNLGMTGGERRLLYWGASFLAALTVAVAGVIGFVGLMVPHVVRGFAGPRHRYLIPVSAVAGAAFLTMADTVGRVIISPYQLPVGIITGFAGGLFFLVYMRKGSDS